MHSTMVWAVQLLAARTSSVTRQLPTGMAMVLQRGLRQRAEPICSETLRQHTVTVMGNPLALQQQERQMPLAIQQLRTIIIMVNQQVRQQQAKPTHLGIPQPLTEIVMATLSEHPPQARLTPLAIQQLHTETVMAIR